MNKGKHDPKIRFYKQNRLISQHDQYITKG